MSAADFSPDSWLTITSIQVFGICILPYTMSYIIFAVQRLLLLTKQEVMRKDQSVCVYVSVCKQHKLIHCIQILMNLLVSDRTTEFFLSISMNNLLLNYSLKLTKKKYLGYWHQRADERHGNPLHLTFVSDYQ